MTSGGASPPAACCLLIGAPPLPPRPLATLPRPIPRYSPAARPPGNSEFPRARRTSRTACWASSISSSSSVANHLPVMRFKLVLGNEHGALAGGFLRCPGPLPLGERHRARPDRDRARGDLRHQGRQLGQVATRRDGALAAALEAE